MLLHGQRKRLSFGTDRKKCASNQRRPLRLLEQHVCVPFFGVVATLTKFGTGTVTTLKIVTEIENTIGNDSSLKLSVIRCDLNNY